MADQRLVFWVDQYIGEIGGNMKKLWLSKEAYKFGREIYGT